MHAKQEKKCRMIKLITAESQIVLLLAKFGVCVAELTLPFEHNGFSTRFGGFFYNSK